MAKIIKFPLKMKNGAEVRSLEELQENFDLESVLGYFADGRLKTWLVNRYYDEKAEAVAALSADMPDLNARLCAIFGVEYEQEADETDIELIQRRNEKLRILQEITADKDILDNVDLVAMDQDELFDILDASPEKVYLYGEKFSIPLGRNNICYIGINKPTIVFEKNKYIFDYESNNLIFINTEYENTVNLYVTKGEMLFLKGQFKEAYPLIKDSAESGSPRAMYLMASYYNDGYGTIHIDTEKRNKWCEKAFSYKEPISMYGYAAWCIEDEHEKQKIYSDIFPKINEMAWDRDIIAQYVLGLMYFNGDGVTQDHTEAVKWYTKAAEQGHAKAQYNLGVMYEKGEGVTRSFKEAVKWYTKAAEQGLDSAQYNLGNMYKKGYGVSYNYTEALKWYTKAAEQGYAIAQYKLGDIYSISYNYTEALKWYTKAAEQGNTMAQYNLGLIYENGEFVSQDYAEALKWYTKAAEQGYANAQYNLGNMYKNGCGVSHNYTEALKWYAKAAEQGYADAQYILAENYYYGDHVERNRDEAAKWYKKAAENGNEDAKKRINVLNRTNSIVY